MGRLPFLLACLVVALLAAHAAHLPHALEAVEHDGSAGRSSLVENPVEHLGHGLTRGGMSAHRLDTQADAGSSSVSALHSMAHDASCIVQAVAPSVRAAVTLAFAVLGVLLLPLALTRFGFSQPFTPHFSPAPRRRHALLQVYRH